MTYYIYETTNNINGMKYIGKHCWEGEGIDTKYFGSGKHLVRALKKYGLENFSVKILEECTEENINDREIYWIDYFNAVNSKNYYNLAYGGQGFMGGELNPMYGKFGDLNPNYGNHWSDEQKRRQSENHKSKGINAGEKNYMYGRKHTEEERKKSGEVNVGKKFSKERIEKMRETFSGEGNPRYGVTLSDETKEKIRKAGIRRYEENPELKTNQSSLMKSYYKTHKHPREGVTLTEETRRKISNSRKGKKLSSETRAKMREAQIGVPKKSLRKAVRCVETQQVFECAKDAVEFLGFSTNSVSNITRCARHYKENIEDKAFGFHWEFVEK